VLFDFVKGSGGSFVIEEVFVTIVPFSIMKPAFLTTTPRVFSALVALSASSALAQYADWKGSGSLFRNTTPDGANIAASVTVEEFPVLVRLNGKAVLL
jgi:hypothetical protein